MEISVPATEISSQQKDTTMKTTRTPPAVAVRAMADKSAGKEPLLAAALASVRA
jgi:hypothetical protein